MNFRSLLFYFFAIIVIATAAAAPRTALADERLKGIACRSVHLQYIAPEGKVFYNEVTVDQTAPGTYFCVCGFQRGYYGIQEKANGDKVLIFSVWDPGNQNDPKKVKADRRVQLLDKDKRVLVRRFGNEGTGGQSFFAYEWKRGETYRFLVSSEKIKDRTAFSAYFFHPEEKSWIRLVTFATLANGVHLRGYYSFVEDFRRNRISATKTRKAYFGKTWRQSLDGKWTPMNNARFTADRNPVTNIDAGVAKDLFYLTTGGVTKNTGTPLWKSMHTDADKMPPTLASWIESNTK